jgi:hypothetical protein
MSDQIKKPTQEELMKAVADVLDEAIAEYEALSKEDMAVQEVPAAAEGIDNAQVVADPTKAAPAPAPEASAAAQAPGIDAAKPEALKSEDEKSQEEKDKEEKEKKDKEDAADMETHKSLTAKLEAKGLLRKSDPVAPLTAAPVAAVAAAAPVAAAPAEGGEEFRKSVDSRLEILGSAIREVSETVKKIAAAPAPRRGFAGYKPLAKSDTSEAPQLKKGDLVEKLLDLKKSGSNIDTSLVNRVETNRLTKSDLVNLRNLGILG